MDCPINPAELQKLKLFVQLCSMNPQMLNLPQLDFIKAFVEKLGGKVPPNDASASGPKPQEAGSEPKKPEPAAEPAAEPAKEQQDPDSEPESDLELDTDGCVEPDTDVEQPMGDGDKEPSEEECDQANELRAKAAAAYGEQNFDEAVKLFTDAINLNPRSALYYAKRGQAYLKLQKPNACIRDCIRALEINPDSATAYKFRGRAHRLLGRWEEAAQDLRQACKLDFDEEADEWLKEVTPNAKKIEQHKQKQERRRQEKEFRARQNRYRQAQDANRQASEDGKQGAGGATGGGDDMHNLPEWFDALQDPEVAAAMMDITADINNISKYRNNPKIMEVAKKLSKLTKNFNVD